MFTGKFSHLRLAVITLFLMTSVLRAQFDAGVVVPNDTDQAINTHNNVHTWALSFNQPHRNKLFVFLPGTGGIPFVYQQIVRAAANNGFHSIGLMYPNSTSINEVCAYKFDPACHENTRMEIIDGTNRTTLFTVNRANSIENRLIKLLEYLHSNDVAYGWGQYLDSQTNLVWSNIVIAGHSQGGSHAAIIAKTRLVHRCLMFAAMDWRIPEDQPPDWVSDPGLTPPERYIGLGHYDDEVVSYNRLAANWQALNMDQFAPEHLVDGSYPSYDASHMLMTDLPSSNEHSCMISDLAMITNGSGSVYLPVWQWMLIGPTVLPELTISNQIVVSYEARPDWQYRLQYSSNLINYTQVGLTVSGSSGVISTVVSNQSVGNYRVVTDY